jgi:SAM-dependent methyltransferase
LKEIKKMILLLLDNSLRVQVFYEEPDAEFEDNVCISFLEDCPEDEKIFRADETNIFLTPRQAAQLAETLNNAAAESKLALRKSEQHERRFDGDLERLRSPERLQRLQVDQVASLSLEGIDAKNVLDVGTGSGLFAEAFAAHGLQVTGIDVNPEMIQAASRQVPGIDFQVAPAEDLPFPDNSFDLVFLGLVYHETDDALKAIQEAHRVTRHRVAILEWPYIDESIGPPMAHRLKAEEVAALARKAGCEKIETLLLKHTVLYRLCK